MTLLAIVVCLLWATGIVWWSKRPPKTPANRLMRNLSRLIERDFNQEDHRLYPALARKKQKVMLISVDYNPREGVARWEVEVGDHPLYQRYHREAATP